MGSAVWRGAVALACSALVSAAAAGLPHQLVAQVPDITVAALPSFRPVPVQLPGFAFTVGLDSATGGVALRLPTFAPVTFAGTVRVEGHRPGDQERRPDVPDSLRFSADGRLTLLVADAASLISVEPRGSRGGSAARLVITAPRWPFGRLFMVSLEPSDLHEYRWRSVGYGVRDQIRVDAGRGLAFLTDTSIAGVVVAVGGGRGTRPIIRTDVTSVVLERRFGEEIGRERRQVGRMLLAIAPQRDSAGNARAEIVFGIGATAEQAAGAALAVSAEADDAAVAAWPSVSTPHPTLDLAFTHLLGAANPALGALAIQGVQVTPSLGGGLSGLRPADAWRVAVLARQLGRPRTPCREHDLARRLSGTGVTRGEIAPRLTAAGPIVWAESTASSAAAEADAGFVLGGYACLLEVRDSALLAAVLPAARQIGQRVAASGAAAGVSADALERLAELEEAAARSPEGAEASRRWRAEAARMRTAVTSSRGTGPGGAWGVQAPGADSWRSRLAGIADGLNDPARRAAAWRDLVAAGEAVVRASYGRPGERVGESGLSLATAGSIVELVGGVLFGVEERLGHVRVAPRVDGIADDHLWVMERWRLSGDSLSVAYRPRERSAVIRVGATRRSWRLVLGFPWISPNSCVTLRRGALPPEGLGLVAMADGSAFVDVRVGFDPAELTVQAAPCSGS
jgi:hypothetical protein